VQEGDAGGVIDDAEAGGGDREAGVVAGDAEVAAARELDAGAEDVAVQDGDEGGVGAAQGGGGGEERGVGREVGERRGSSGRASRSKPAQKLASPSPERMTTSPASSPRGARASASMSGVSALRLRG
jgi:hypothetical protein